MQKTQIIGFLGRNAEIKDLNYNQVINFPVAVTESWKNKDGIKQEKTTWYECAKWGNNTAVAQYLTKGTQVYVEGTVEADAYIDKDGTARAALRLKVFKLELLSGGNKNTQGTPQQTPQPKPQTESRVDVSEEEDDLPF